MARIIVDFECSCGRSLFGWTGSECVCDGCGARYWINGMAQLFTLVEGVHA